MDPATYLGIVVKRPFGAGSKSERDAILLVTKDKEYVLRRQGGNAFHDSELERLVGKQVQCKGVVTGYTLLVSDCAIVDPAA
jgi:hypothetical protein